MSTTVGPLAELVFGKLCETEDEDPLFVDLRWAFNR